jgi:hypothetical protein
MKANEKLKQHLRVVILKNTTRVFFGGLLFFIAISRVNNHFFWT